MLARILAPSLVVVLFGCGAGDPAVRYEEAYSAFEEASAPADYDGVLGDLTRLASDVSREGPADLAFQVAYLSLRCRARKGDETTPQALGALRDEYPAEMGRIERYLEICNDLAKGKKAMAAVQVIKDCQVRFPDSKDKLAGVASKVGRVGDDKVRAALDSLGYLSGGN